MRNNKPLFNPIEVDQSELTDDTHAIILFINAGIDLYQNYHYLNSELYALGEQRRRIQSVLNNKLSMADISELTLQLKNAEFKRAELEWHQYNADRLADSDIEDKLIKKVFSDHANAISNLLRHYQQAASYVLHSSAALCELADELLPTLEKCTVYLRKNVAQYSEAAKQAIVFRQQLQQEKWRIAAAMALRIEAAFYYKNLHQDDALVYVYHQLMRSGALNDQAPLHKPQGSLTVDLLAKFYNYVQDNGSDSTRARLSIVISNSSGAIAQALKIENRIINKKTYAVPLHLSRYIPLKKPLFWWGDRFRYQFFKKYSGTLLMLKMYSHWGSHYNLRHEVRRHRDQLNALVADMTGVRGFFLKKTKRFLAEWQRLLHEEQRSWASHYELLKKQVYDYLHHPEDGYQKRDVLWSHLSVFIAEINQYRPSATQFITSLEVLKSKLDERDTDSIDSYQIKALEDEVAGLDNSDDESVLDIKRKRIMSWGSGLFGSLAYDAADSNAKRSYYEPR